MGSTTPWSLRLQELLADGQWRRRDELVAQVGPLIPPGRAMRTRERMAEEDSRRRDRNGRQRPREVSVEMKLAVGRRRLIVQILTSRGGVYEVKRDERGVVWVRRAR